jgi:phage terminase large subunit
MNIPHNWKPRGYQLELFRALQTKKIKRAFACWHRRSGKDEVALHWAAVAAVTRPATYWHMLPEAAQARKAIWNAINPHSGKRRIDEAFPQEIRTGINEQEMFIKIVGGSTFQLVGSDNYNSLVGSPPAGVTFSEYALANPLAWGYLRPILLENDGWALFITTPRGRNHAATLFENAEADPNWFAQKLTVKDTGIFTQEQLDNELRELAAEHGETVGRSLFKQEYYCSFDAAILGSIYGEWIEKAEAEGRVKLDIFDPELPVYTVWDLGYGDATAVWFYQLAYGEVRLIDYWEDTQRDAKQCCEVLYGREINIEALSPETSAVTKWSFGHSLPAHAHRSSYNYHLHSQPHDAAYKLQTARGRSFAQQCHEFGIRAVVIQPTNQETAIQATRKLFPQFWFDKAKCKEGLNVLRNYQFEYDADTKIFRKTPLHNWASHGSKALEIIGRTNINTVKQEKEPEKPRFLHETTANEIFWGENSQNVYRRERI